LWFLFPPEVPRQTFSATPSKPPSPCYMTISAIDTPQLREGGCFFSLFEGRPPPLGGRPWEERGHDHVFRNYAPYPKEIRESAGLPHSSFGRGREDSRYRKNPLSSEEGHVPPSPPPLFLAPAQRFLFVPFLRCFSTAVCILFLRQWDDFFFPH